MLPLIYESVAMTLEGKLLFWDYALGGLIIACYFKFINNALISSHLLIVTVSYVPISKAEM